MDAHFNEIDHFTYCCDLNMLPYNRRIDMYNTKRQALCGINIEKCQYNKHTIPF